MQFTKTALFSLLAGLAAASPVPESKSMVASVPAWTMVNFKRMCNAEDTSCTVVFGIDTNQGQPSTWCWYTTTAAHEASRAPASNVDCGPYKVSSGWDGSFGEGNGFTTWSVVDFSKRLIVWPAYTDKQLASGQPVKPDQSYQPQSISW